MDEIRKRIALGVVLLAFSCAAETQAVPSVEDLAPVEVLSPRNPADFDAAKAAVLIQRFEKIAPASRSRIRLSFYVRMRSGRPLPSGLRLSLWQQDEFIRYLKLLPSGEVEIPLLVPDEPGAVVAANTPAGDLQINYFVQPRVTAPFQPLGDLREAMRQARSAWAVLYGPLLGWTVPRFDCIAALYREPSQVRMRTVARDLVWESERSTKVMLPLDSRDHPDDLQIEWGPVLPDRVGGCVWGQPQDAGH